MTDHRSPGRRPRPEGTPSQMWAWGDYPRVASDLIAELGPVVVEAAGITARDRVLDVAAGAGNASACPRRRRARRSSPSDLTPELLAAGRREAERRGLSLEWVEADVESLPFPDADFDVVISVVGAMFAPHHQQTADEILRVCRPGGTVAMINWSRQGLIGQLFATMAPYAPPPPPGAQPPRCGATRTTSASSSGTGSGPALRAPDRRLPALVPRAGRSARLLQGLLRPDHRAPIALWPTTPSAPRSWTATSRTSSHATTTVPPAPRPAPGARSTCIVTARKN